MCEPLTPPQCDLRGMEHLPFDVQYWRDCAFTLGSSDEEFRAGMMLVWASWHQTPAASLPNDDGLLMAMCGWGRKASLDEWLRIKKGVLADWVLCSDDRYYHPMIAEKALVAWKDRSGSRGLRAGSDAATPLTRVQKLRHEHKAMRVALKQFYGVTMRSTASIDAVRQALTQARQDHPEVASAERPMTQASLASQENIQEPLQAEATASHATASQPRFTTTAVSQETLVSPTQASGEIGGDQIELEGLDGDLLAGLIPPLPGVGPGKRSEVPNCPVERFVKLYEEHMPRNPKVRLISDTRRRRIRDIWKWASTKGDLRPFLLYKTTEEGLQAWGKFFSVCGRIPFLVGDAEPRKPDGASWVADIDFFTRQDVVIKCIEGKYGAPQDLDE